jgi:hypothetical protein
MFMNRAPEPPHQRFVSMQTRKSTGKAVFVASPRGGVSCNWQPEAPCWA